MFLFNERVQAIFFLFHFNFAKLSWEVFCFFPLSFCTAFGSKHSLRFLRLTFLCKRTKRRNEKNRKRKSFSLLKDLPRVPSILNSVPPFKLDFFFFLNTSSTSVFLRVLFRCTQVVEKNVFVFLAFHFVSFLPGEN